MSKPYPILGLLQNPWAYEAKSAQEFMDRGHKERRRWIMNAMPKSPTGRRLRKSLGDYLFSQIVWDNADPTVSDFPHYHAKPDASHVARLIGHYAPKVIVCYGKVAEAAVQGQHFQGMIVYCCHPTYRHDTTIARLAETGEVVKKWVLQAGFMLPEYTPTEMLE